MNASNSICIDWTQKKNLLVLCKALLRDGLIDQELYDKLTHMLT